VNLYFVELALIHVIVVSAYIMQVLKLTENVMVILLCRRTSSSSSDSCSPDGASIKVFGRPGVQIDNDELRRLMLDVRVRTQTCVHTKRLQRVQFNGLSNKRVVLIPPELLVVSTGLLTGWRVLFYGATDVGLSVVSWCCPSAKIVFFLDITLPQNGSIYYMFKPKCSPTVPPSTRCIWEVEMSKVKVKNEIVLRQ